MYVNDFRELGWFAINLKAGPHHPFDDAMFCKLGMMVQTYFEKYKRLMFNLEDQSKLL